MRLLFILFFISSFSAYGKETIKITLPIDSITNKISIDTVVTAPKQTKEKLFGIINQWIAINYKSAKDVIQLNDKENGIIIVKGVFPNVYCSGMASPPDVSHAMTIKIKEGKVKISFNNFVVDYSSYGSTFNLEDAILGKISSHTSNLYPYQKMQIQNSLQKIINESIQSISEKMNLLEKDDW